VARIPVLVEGADPGTRVPRALAVRDHLLVDVRLVDDHDPSRLFAYEVTARDLHLRGLAAPGDRIVFRRGGAVAPDRICAVRAASGVVLSPVLVNGRSMFLLTSDGRFEPLSRPGGAKGEGTIAGTQLLLIRR
jgi:hypothetical protein